MNRIFQVSAFSKSYSVACFFALAVSAWPFSAEAELAKTSSEVEMRVALKKASYDKLKQAMTFEASSEREDLYFEIYDPSASRDDEINNEVAESAARGQFLLRERKPAEKLRITNKAGNLKWQYSRKVASSTVSSNSLKLQLSQTDAVSIKGKDYPDLARIFQAGCEVFAALSRNRDFSSENLLGSGRRDSLRSQILALDENIRSKDGLIEKIENLPEGIMVTAAVSRKLRQETSLEIGNVEFEVQLGSSTRIDDLGNQKIAYEIEAEKEGALEGNDSETAKLFLKMLEQWGLSAQDIEESSFDTMAYSLKKYQSMGITK